MNRYRCWVDGSRTITEQVIEAASSFEARKKLAKKHGVAVTDCVSERIFEEQAK